jgi:hypothetical protein
MKIYDFKYKVCFNGTYKSSKYFFELSDEDSDTTDYIGNSIDELQKEVVEDDKECFLKFELYEMYDTNELVGTFLNTDNDVVALMFRI